MIFMVVFIRNAVLKCTTYLPKNAFKKVSLIRKCKYMAYELFHAQICKKIFQI